MGLDLATERAHSSPHISPQIITRGTPDCPNGIHIRRQATPTVRKQANLDFAISRLCWRTGHPVRLSGVEVDYGNDTYPELNRQAVCACGLLGSSVSFASLIVLASKPSRVFQDGDH